MKPLSSSCSDKSISRKRVGGSGGAGILSAPSLQNILSEVPMPPEDEWNAREKLALASAVVKVGDRGMNKTSWDCVSQLMVEWNEGYYRVTDLPRPPDWFSGQACEAQYLKLVGKIVGLKGRNWSSTGKTICKRLTRELMTENQNKMELLRERAATLATCQQFWSSFSEQERALVTQKLNELQSSRLDGFKNYQEDLKKRSESIRKYREAMQRAAMAQLETERNFLNLSDAESIPQSQDEEDDTKISSDHAGEDGSSDEIVESFSPPQEEYVENPSSSDPKAAHLERTEEKEFEEPRPIEDVAAASSPNGEEGNCDANFTAESSASEMPPPTTPVKQPMVPGKANSNKGSATKLPPATTAKQGSKRHVEREEASRPTPIQTPRTPKQSRVATRLAETEENWAGKQRWNLRDKPLDGRTPTNQKDGSKKAMTAHGSTHEPLSSAASSTSSRRLSEAQRRVFEYQQQQLKEKRRKKNEQRRQHRRNAQAGQAKKALPQPAVPTQRTQAPRAAKSSK